MHLGSTDGTARIKDATSDVIQTYVIAAPESLQSQASQSARDSIDVGTATADIRVQRLTDMRTGNKETAGRRARLKRRLIQSRERRIIVRNRGGVVLTECRHCPRALLLRVVGGLLAASRLLLGAVTLCPASSKRQRCAQNKHVSPILYHVSLTVPQSCRPVSPLWFAPSLRRSRAAA